MANLFGIKHLSSSSRSVREVASAFVAIDVHEFHFAPGTARAVLRIDGAGKVTIPITWEPTGSIFGGIRCWWKCPTCASRRRFLRLKGNRVGCVPCLGLAYSSRCVRWKAARSLHRAQRLRERLGADRRLFSPLPSHPRPVRGYTRLIEELRLCERELLGKFVPRRKS
jgi:hypothetical protein